MIGHDFMKQVLANEKKLMKVKDIRCIQPPKYDEISVKNLYPKLLSLAGMSDYFPDKFPTNKQCDREYMFQIANTLYPEVMADII